MSDSPPHSLPSWFDGLVRAARTADGQPPFSDQALVDARTGERELLVLGDYAAAIVSPTEAELVVHPDVRRRGHGSALLETVIRGSGPGLLVWSHGDHPGARALAARYGFEAERKLLQLRADLDGAEGDTRGLSLSKSAVQPDSSTGSANGGVSTSSTNGGGSTGGGVSTGSTSGVGSTSGGGSASGADPSYGIDTFRPGIDDAAWLALNARAFAFHPEQGSVDQGDLDELKAEPWFAADDFLVLRDGEKMIGYCWLKLEDGIGELYVVGVDPDRQREGLGRRLVEAGLARLRELDIHTAALYVEGDNTPALHLYESFGFTEYAVDIQYRLTRFTSR